VEDHNSRIQLELLEEVLITAAMNLLTSADTAAKRENHVLGSFCSLPQSVPANWCAMNDGPIPEQT
jgi:hypothetical protein